MDEIWHIQCLRCGHRYYHEDSNTVIHNPGKDWEDSSSYCPSCGQPNESHDHDYRMHNGPIPAIH